MEVAENSKVGMFMSMFDDIHLFAKENEKRTFETRWQSRNVMENILLNVRFFRGPRQERCWHRSGVGKFEGSSHLVTAWMVLEVAITEHPIFVCTDTSSQK